MTDSRMLVLGVLSAVAVCVCAAGTAWSQDPVKVDPAHHKVEFENNKVRVLRITIGPHEKTAMHEHPASVAVFLKDQHARFTLPDGKQQESSTKAGDVVWEDAGAHVVENTGDAPAELILVELKAGGAHPVKKK
jgi:beta-alanine degradation protein BauB